MGLRHALRIRTAEKARLALAFSVVAGVSLVASAGAGAAWTSGGAGMASGRALSMPAGAAPAPTVISAAITLTWDAVTISGASVDHYLVRRYSETGVLQSVSAGCAGPITVTSCTETNVPAGRWTYTTRPVKGGWTGAESGKSATAEVDG